VVDPKKLLRRQKRQEKRRERLLREEKEAWEAMHRAVVAHVDRELEALQGPRANEDKGEGGAPAACPSRVHTSIHSFIVILTSERLGQGRSQQVEIVCTHTQV
jgi:hypothetical protein